MGHCSFLQERLLWLEESRILTPEGSQDHSKCDWILSDVCSTSGVRVCVLSILFSLILTSLLPTHPDSLHRCYWVPERLCESPKVTQVVSGKRRLTPGFWTLWPFLSLQWTKQRFSIILSENTTILGKHCCCFWLVLAMMMMWEGVSVSMCICMYKCTETQRPEVMVGCLPHTSHFTSREGWAARTCLSPPPLYWITDTHLAFNLVGPTDLNSGLHACGACTLWTISPALSFIFFVNIQSNVSLWFLYTRPSYTQHIFASDYSLVSSPSLSQ